MVPLENDDPVALQEEPRQGPEEDRVPLHNALELPLGLGRGGAQPVFLLRRRDRGKPLGRMVRVRDRGDPQEVDQIPVEDEGPEMFPLLGPFLEVEKEPFEGAVEQEALEPGDLSGRLLLAFRQMKIAEDYIIETGLPSVHRFPRLSHFPTINQSDRTCKRSNPGAD